jgi:hypothetical protein
MMQLRQMSLLQVMLGIPLLEGTSPASSFPRIAFGYDAVCYSYIWSEVWAIQILSHISSIIYLEIVGKKLFYLNYVGVCC